MSESAGPLYAVFAYQVNRLFLDASSATSSLSPPSHYPPNGQNGQNGQNGSHSGPSSGSSSSRSKSPGGGGLSTSLPSSSFQFPSGASGFSLPSSSPISAAATGGGVNEFLRKQATASDEFSLSITRSNMPGERAQMLRAFLIPKLSKGTLYTGTGETAKIGPSVCYYCLVRNEATERTKIEDQKEEGSYFSEEYVICFVTTFANDDDEGFDLFRQELDEYCKEIASELFAVETEQADATNLKNLLENWYEVNVEYVSRSISILQSLLDSLLYFVLEGRSVYVIGKKKAALDVIKFCAASSILQLLPVPAGSDHTKLVLPFYFYESESQIPPKERKMYEPEPVILKVDTSGATLQTTVSNPFCQEWARKLIDSQSDINQMNKGGSTFSASLLLRRILENCKVKAMQEVNTFKRLIRKAEADHYSLFACSQYLQGNANRNVLMNVLRNDMSLVEDNPDAAEVLGVLSDFVALHG